MNKNEKTKYFSQLKSFPWEMVAKSSCGITSAAMAISYFDKSITPMDVLRKASELHTVPENTVNYWLVVSNDSGNFSVPVGRTLSKRFIESSERENLKIVKEGGSRGEYQPCFTIATGYDHRGSKRLFGAFDIKAEMLGDKNNPIDLKEVEREVRVGNMFLISASRKKDPWKDVFLGGPSNHIMLIIDIVKKDGKEYFYILDPFNTESERLVHMEEISSMADFEFNGYGTVIYTK